MADDIRTTTTGVYLEVTPDNSIRATATGIYLEVVLDTYGGPFRVAGNVSVTYHGVDITGYLDSASLDAIAALADVSNLAGDAQEQIPTLFAWTCPVGGPWDRPVDDVLGPELWQLPDGGRTCVIGVGPSDLVTYTWSAGAFIREYHVLLNSPRDAIRWTGTLVLSGAPGRA